MRGALTRSVLVSSASRGWALVLSVCLGAACGAAAPRRADRLREDLREALAAPPTEAATRAAAAIDATAASEASSTASAALEADEHATRARAWAVASVDERTVAVLEAELGALEAELLELEASAGALEHEAAERRATNQAAADARAAREELVRALARAEADESAPRRARRLGVSEPADVRRFAEVIEDRARVLLAAATAMGAREVTIAPARAALDASAASEEPLAHLGLADRAHGLARAALADARHHAGATPEASEIDALTEALESEGFAPHRGEQGLGARLEGVFEGPGIAPAMRGRVRRLAELLASHPHGPIVLLVEADADRAGQALAGRRLEALRRALLGPQEGTEPAREVVVAVLVEVRVPGGEVPPAANAARVLLSAYVPRGPEPTAPPAAPTPDAPAGDSVQANAGE